ncbi:hypothetical protein H4582DRAFT_2066128 [Lactarius indigo]|nr:hypothetical protein H4582DRAFT_2066128 [Lactarius indigo]
MQISGHELWALGQWELVFAALLGLASSISGLAVPPEVTEAVQQPPRAVRRRSSPSACRQGDSREWADRNPIHQPIVLLPESITRCLEGHVLLTPYTGQSGVAMRNANVACEGVHTGRFEHG